MEGTLAVAGAQLSEHLRMAVRREVVDAVVEAEVQLVSTEGKEEWAESEQPEASLHPQWCSHPCSALLYEP